MTSNLGKIRRDLEMMRKQFAPTTTERTGHAEREAFKGNKQKAIEIYKEIMYDAKPYVKANHKRMVELYQMSKERIEKLGG